MKQANPSIIVLQALVVGLLLVSCAHRAGSDAVAEEVEKSGGESARLTLRSDANSSCLPAEIETVLRREWSANRADFSAAFSRGVQKGDATAFYKGADRVINLLRASNWCNYEDLLTDIVDYLAIPFLYQKDLDGVKTWVDLKGKEINMLSLTQYLYAVMSAAHAVSMVSDERRSGPMNAFLAKSGLLFRSHLWRWAFGKPFISFRSWGCQSKSARQGRHPRYNHSEALRALIAGRVRESESEARYCEMVQDRDLWMVAGTVEFLAAKAHVKSLASLSDREQSVLHEYVQMGVKFLQSRVTLSRLRDAAGKSVAGFEFDTGMRDAHEDYAYSGYDGQMFPTKAEKRRSSNVGWDISHARRLVHVFETLHRNRDVSGLRVPDDETMRAMANQFAYVIFNGSYDRPLFHNFFDGSNGWYRVGYQNKPKFGYGPYMMSDMAAQGGYGFLAAYNPDVRRILDAILRVMFSPSPADVAHRTEYYRKKDWLNGDRAIQFLSVFAQPPMS